MILSDPMKEDVMLSESVERSEAVRAEQMVVPAWMEQQALSASEWVRVQRKSAPALGMRWVVAVEPVAAPVQS